jgi:hypothetical protein
MSPDEPCAPPRGAERHLQRRDMFFHNRAGEAMVVYNFSISQEQPANRP